MNENLLTLEDVTKRLKVSMSTLRKFIKEGMIKTVNISDRGDKRITEEALQEFITKNTR